MKQMDKFDVKISDKVAQTVRWIAGINAVISIAIGIVGGLTEELSLLMAFASFVLLVSSVWIGLYLPKHLRLEQRRQQTVMQKSFLQLLAQYRHDVMNQIQLVKGYMQLNKYDRLDHPIQTLILTSQKHSLMSNLPGDRLPFFLIEQDLSCSMISLQIVLEMESAQLYPKTEEQLITMLQCLLAAGEHVSKEHVIQVAWNLRIMENQQEIAIILHVSGEHVNDTYITSLSEQLSAYTSVWQIAVDQDNHYRITLQSRKLGEIKCL